MPQTSGLAKLSGSMFWRQKTTTAVLDTICRTAVWQRLAKIKHPRNTGDGSAVNPEATPTTRDAKMSCPGTTRQSKSLANRTMSPSPVSTLTVSQLFWLDRPTDQVGFCFISIQDVLRFMCACSLVYSFFVLPMCAILVVSRL